ncbi:MAG: hypothetical protein ACUVRZ_12980, partial [Desulfobacca sp.]|uniref:hypothetical protein n=1 Tax=Desulfobacca sp. TaxID=2067990 RepID=UPI00404AC298
VVALARQPQGDWVIAATGRFFARLAPTVRPPVGKEVWQDTRLLLPAAAPGNWREELGGHLITGEVKGLPLAAVFAQLPVALLRPAGD